MSGLRAGIYETEYGNAAIVRGPKAKTAYDIDMGMRIPISMVTDKFLREIEDADDAFDDGGEE